MHNKNYYSVVK